MKKLISSHRERKKLKYLIIASILVLALLAFSLETVSGDNQESSTLRMRPATEELSSKTLERAENLRACPTSYENLGILKKLGLHTGTMYMLGVIGAAILTFFISPRIISRETKIKKNFLKASRLLESWKTPEIEEINHKSFEFRKPRLFTAIPVLCITLAEVLLFSGKIELAIWVHIGILISLSLSNLFVKDPEVQRIHQALMLLPILRLINLSMPVFFETTLYTFVFVYGCLAIPVAVIIIHQHYSLEQIGISMRNIGTYTVISIPLSFVLGLGEYLTIKAEYLIPDLTFENLLRLTFIMVFFVGLIEELIFRSILQTRLEHILSINESLLITSFLFGLMHSGYGTFYEILYTSFVGLLIGLIFCKTKSLPFIVILHGFINVFLFGVLPHYLTG